MWGPETKPQTHPAEEVHETPPSSPEPGPQEESGFTHSGSREPSSGKQGSLEDSSGKAVDRGSGAGCSQLAPLDRQEKTPGVEKLIRSREKAVSSISG